MLTSLNEWSTIAEVNPPPVPDGSHRELADKWQHVLVTDNVFGKIRVSPYAYAARITHDVPSLHPTVVVSSRDRNILAIESEVRGALGNGVDSFLVVVGDTVPAVDHYAHHYEIVEHLTKLQSVMPPFEVGMPTRFQRWMLDRRIELGAQFFVTGPVLDPETVAENVGRLRLRSEDPPVYMAIIPPFTSSWVDRAESFGAVPATEKLKERLSEARAADIRHWAWDQARRCAEEARGAGCSGVVLMGLKFSTLVGDARTSWM